MCQLANPVTEWGKGRLPPPEGVRRAHRGWLVRNDVPNKVEGNACTTPGGGHSY